jgi:hypothetical protein
MKYRRIAFLQKKKVLFCCPPVRRPESGKAEIFFPNILSVKTFTGREK